MEEVKMVWKLQSRCSFRPDLNSMNSVPDIE